MALWHVTLKQDTRGPRRRRLLNANFDLADPEKRTLRLNLTDDQKAELEASGDYTFRHAAAEPTGRTLTKRGNKPPANPTPETPAADDGASPKTEEA